MAHDPLTLREVSVRFAQADRKLARLARESAQYIHTPTLLMLAGRDRIVANQPTREFLQRSAATHKTLIEYPNGAHTLEFEADPRALFRGPGRLDWADDRDMNCRSLTSRLMIFGSPVVRL